MTDATFWTVIDRHTGGKVWGKPSSKATRAQAMAMAKRLNAIDIRQYGRDVVPRYVVTEVLP